jgi:hypothetical protein
VESKRFIGFVDWSLLAVTYVRDVTATVSKCFLSDDGQTARLKVGKQFSELETTA